MTTHFQRQRRQGDIIWRQFISHILLLSRLYTNVKAANIRIRLTYLSKQYFVPLAKKQRGQKNSARFARIICPPTFKTVAPPLSFVQFKSDDCGISGSMVSAWCQQLSCKHVRFMCCLDVIPSSRLPSKQLSTGINHFRRSLQFGRTSAPQIASNKCRC